MTQNRRLFLGDLGYVGKVRLGHGQTVAVKIVVDAGAQILLAPVDLIILAGLGPLDIVRAADPVVVLGRVIVAEQIPFQAAQNVQLAGVALLQLGDLRLVQGGTLWVMQYSRSQGVWLCPLKPAFADRSAMP